MFTENVKRGRGRPRGESAQGAAARQHLYETAVRLITTRGYHATTLRDIAREADVSVGLLYRYFPSKQSVIVALYDQLSQEFVTHATAAMSSGKWRDRFLVALRGSLEVLQPHRATLGALIPVLVGDPDDGVFGERMAFSRARVQRVFEEAVTAASDSPSPALAGALGRLLYLFHLGVLLWWLLDKSPRQRATHGLTALVAQMLPSAALALRLPAMKRFITGVDGLVRSGLSGVPAEA